MKKIQLLKFIVLTSVAFLSFIISCSESINIAPIYPPATKNNDVSILSSYFDPSPQTVKVNATVTWYNLDYVAHSVTSDSSMFDSGTIPAYGSFSYQFTAKGTFSYHCNLFPAMRGIIIVE